MGKLNNRLTQIVNALRYVGRGDFSGLLKRLDWYRREHAVVKVRKRLAGDGGSTWGILCTPHTEFIANAISARLAAHGMGSEVIIGQLDRFDHAFYIVLCPQMFKSLPPADKRVVFQLEQHVSSRWFTPEYFRILRESLGVLDYSLSNIAFLAQHKVKYPTVHYLPIGAVTGGATGMDTAKKYDFVFYGDSLSSERRRAFLKQLQSRYSVKICNEVFGEEMYEIIRSARAVINIHYYEGALLEMPRISECISLGVPILSESSRDRHDYPELAGAVRFFEEGSIEAMMSAAQAMLDDIDAVNATIDGVVAASASRFNFMFDRFLGALGMLPANVVLETPIYLREKSSFLALSLPETVERRQAITEALPEGCVIFDGIRNSLGWVGCGSSFTALSRYALDNGMKRLIVIEDDILLPPDFGRILGEVMAYLDTCEGNWDIFSGVMADLHTSARVLSVDDVDGRTYVTIDKMMSNVFNIYSERALKRLSAWNPMDTDASTNTVDRYMERQDDLKVVVALPFIAGHREDVASTLWGIDNDRYAPMIAEAENKIKVLAEKWRAANR